MSSSEPRLTKAWVALVCFVQMYVPHGTVSFQTHFGEPSELVDWKRAIDFRKPESFETLNIGAATKLDGVRMYNDLLKRTGLEDK